jgi:protein-S-isoprenylcysteine O-methyltransferase Ste14
MSDKQEDVPFPWNYIRNRFLFKLVHCDQLPAGQGFKHKIPIDIMKASTLPFCMLMAYKYKNYSPTMMTYTAIHGSYGILWLLKSLVYPDPKWEKQVPWSQFGVVLFGLGTFWYSPYLIASKSIEHSNPSLAALTIWYVFGVFLHFGSDLQKAITLELNPGKLITNRFFGFVRHPNYLGEFMIYSTFVLLSKSPLMQFYFANYMLISWVPNMIWKERSMSRYEEWKAYAKRVKAFLPFIY